jgi:uncharacterized protein (DUF433 family)
MRDNLDLVGVGLYTWQEAARLIAVPTLELRRWLKGYAFPDAEGDARRMPALWEPDLAASDVDGIAFQDLVEARVVRALRHHGVSLQFIRRARKEASAMFGTKHPFSTRSILTDGRAVFANTMSDDTEEPLLDLVKRQLVFRRVIAPSLKGLEFDTRARAVRWFPLERRTVVIDPQVAFGKPVVMQGYVRTDILADAVAVERDAARVARLYEVPVEAVNAAIEFEERLAA